MYQMVHCRPCEGKSCSTRSSPSSSAAGIGDRSLRDIAAAVGTSHRMLIHHFGSREGLLTEVVRTVEANQRASSRRSTCRPTRAMARCGSGSAIRGCGPRSGCSSSATPGRAAARSPTRAAAGLVDDWLDRASGRGRTRRQAPTRAAPGPSAASGLRSSAACSWTWSATGRPGRRRRRVRGVPGACRARPRARGSGPSYGPAVNDVLATIRLRIAELSLNAWSVAAPDVHIETLPELPTLTIR